jgi:hypothetical protein
MADDDGIRRFTINRAFCPVCQGFTSMDAARYPDGTIVYACPRHPDAAHRVSPASPSTKGGREE